MKTVIILGYPGASATSITAAADLFCSAGVSFPYLKSEPVAARFRVYLATAEGTPVRCANGLEMPAHCALAECIEPDLIMVPALGTYGTGTALRTSKIIDYLAVAGSWPCDIASSGAGAFLTAEAGLLDGRLATIHWGFSEAFQTRYPQVKLREELRITSDGNRFCAAGGVAWMQLILHLIERHCGYEIATQVARTHVLDYRREGPAWHSALLHRKSHRDTTIRTVETWLEQHYATVQSLHKLALKFEMSPRNFMRRFKRATGCTPLDYLQQLRIEAAKRRLQQSDMNVDEVTRQVGYEDVSSFSKLFHARTGMTPSQYRQRFANH